MAEARKGWWLQLRNRKADSGQNCSNYDFKLVWLVLHPSLKEFIEAIYWQEQNNDVLFIESF